MKLLYRDGIVNGDCVSVLKAFRAGTINLIVTDPPYLANYRSRDGQTLLNDNDDRWLRPAYAEMYRVLKPNSFCVSFYGWPQVHKFQEAWLAAGFRPVGHIVWRKRYCSNRRLLNYKHESAFLLAKGNPTPRKILDDVLDWEYSGNRLHPTQKPLNVILPLVEAYSQPEDVVLDPFAGSGTTLVAARQLGRKCVGIELDSRYADTARLRLRTEGLRQFFVAR